MYALPLNLSLMFVVYIQFMSHKIKPQARRLKEEQGLEMVISFDKSKAAKEKKYMCDLVDALSRHLVRHWQCGGRTGPRSERRGRRS